eukprot:TRINITY_DN64651_c0_g1_i1.p1 TRINITY_DN64651_c0_g1~~TRINITY_DN64651_c0_g1_i1.p1  ORF type:complete len:114 (-),score=27.66 TRINITY_DN64651_c0_g1_i1:9-350(-)
MCIRDRMGGACCGGSSHPATDEPQTSQQPEAGVVCKKTGGAAGNDTRGPQTSPAPDGELIVLLGFGTLEVSQKVAQQRLSLIHISEPTRLLSISYAVFCLKKKNNHKRRNPVE